MSALSEIKTVPGQVDRIVFDEAEIQTRVGELARRIDRDYRGRHPLVVGVLKGAALFTADLVRRLRVSVDLDYLALSSYSPQPEGEQVEILKDVTGPVRGRDVLLVEDIVDTGCTLHFLLERLGRREPASVRVCTLLNRPDLRLIDLPLQYQGFEVAQQFLVGYGLDFREHYRDLPYIATLSAERASLPVVP